MIIKEKLDKERKTTCANCQKEVHSAEIMSYNGIEFCPNCWEKRESFFSRLEAKNKAFEKRIKTSRDVDELIKILDDSCWRREAATALGKLGDKKAVEPLIQALQTITLPSDFPDKEDIVKALGKLGDVRAIDALTEALKDENHYVYEAAASSLEKLGWKPRNDIEKMYYLYSHKRWYTLAKFGESAVDLFIKAIGEFSLEIFAMEDLIESDIVKSFISIGEPAVEPLCQEKNLINGFYFGIPAYILGEIGDAKAVEPLIEALQLKGDEEHRIRMRAAEALGKIGDNRAIEPLTELLKDKDWIVREKAKDALKKIKKK